MSLFSIKFGAKILIIFEIYNLKKNAKKISLDGKNATEQGKEKAFSRIWNL